MDKPQNLQGFRDFLPAEKRRRDFVARKVTETFELFGFEPLETPTLEYASLLLGKYGKEADKLVYSFKDRGNREVGLRYDQTVPTARVLAQYQNTLPKYFRRYQIQNVFRADKPQKGRFREFTQCDIDIFGSSSPIADAEIISCTYAAFKNVGFQNIIIKMNDRQVLFSTIEPFTKPDVSIPSIIQTIDKIDKIGEDGVVKELINKGLSESESRAVLSAIQKAEPSENLRSILKYAYALGVPPASLSFTPTLARGLDYYTGMIFEVVIPDYEGGSICGGGRYDNLIASLSGDATPAVGMAIGFDRTVDACTTLGIIDAQVNAPALLVTVFEESTVVNSLTVVNELRKNGLPAELFPSLEKLEKQLKFADQKNISYVVIVGPDEVRDNVVVLKSMKTKTQERIPLSTVIQKLTKDH